MSKNPGPQTLDLPETQLIDEMDAWEMEHAYEMELLREESPPPQSLNPRSKRRLFHEGPGSDEPSGSPMPGISRIPTADILELDLNEMSKPTTSASTTSPNRSLAHTPKRSRLIFDEPDDFDLFAEEKENRREPEKIKPVKPSAISSYRDNPLGRSTLSKTRPLGRSVQITGSDGTVLYAKVKNAEQMKAERKRQEHLGASTHLLSTPISMLLHEIRYEKVTSDLAAKESKRLRPNPGETASAKPQKLWVDKYAPSQFIDLLSDQQTNRHVLKWIKSWDECVFGNKASTKLKAETKPLLPKKFQPKTPGQESGHASKDLYHRPEKKILLICGPPGMGKTTLANVAARQAGYNVVEINASDERTSDVLQKKILAASEMKSVFGNNKPNCIIIDEIDGLWNGSGQNPMLAILKLLKGEGKAEKTEGGDEDGDKEKGGKKGKIRPLCRPIICICNDQYAPVLRPLRQESLVLAMRHGNNSRFPERLKEICTKENLQVDLKALANLSDMTEHDIRACLNTLQFLKSKGGSVVTSAMLSNIGVGQKDMKKSLFGIWENLFHITKNRANELNPTPTKYFTQLLATVEAADDPDILLLGCFHNYLSVLSNELTFDKVNNVLEWMHFHDSIQQACHVRQEYEFLAYSSFSIVQFFPNCAVAKRPTLEFPRREFEVQAQIKVNSSILQTVMEGLPSHFKFINKTMMVKDFLSPLIRIISPINFRPLNIQLLTAHELKVLERLVDVMICFNLTFVQVKGFDDQYTYNLEAPIDQLLWFNTEKKKTFIPYNYSAKQLISNEIEKEKLRRSDNKRAIANANVPAGSSSTTSVPARSSTSSSSSAPPVAQPYSPFNFEFQKLSPKKIRPIETEIAKDFFGRPIVPPPPVETQSESKPVVVASSSAPQTRIWYKFNEGFSNAVRKPVFIRDLL